MRAPGTECRRTREDPRECLIPLESLLELRIQSGTHWKRGMGIGAAVGGAIDLAVLVAFAVAFKPVR